MRRRDFMADLAVVTLGSAFSSRAIAGKAKRPNILFIMSDDHDSNTLGCYNSWLKDYCPTPNLDRLAAKGALFENCFAINSLCAPSRATIITGQYSHEHGIYTLREHLNLKDCPSLPKSLQAAGYQTAVYGKWHLHGDNLYGFDDYAVTRGQGRYNDPRFETPAGKLVRQGYAVDVVAEMTGEFIKNRDKKRPFCTMCHFKAAHGPWEYAERFAELYEGIELPEPATLFDDYKNRFPEGISKKRSRIHNPQDLKMSMSTWQSSGKKGKKNSDNPNGNKDYSGLNDREKTKAAYQDFAKAYLRCIAAVDENVGKLVELLEAEGELDNTLIIYTGDQGFFMGEHGFFDKRLGLDEAMRMPLIMRYDRGIRPGTIIDDVVNNVDFAPTILDYSQTAIPPEMSGISFRPLLQGKDPQNKRSATIYYFYHNSVPNHYAVRTKNYKLIKYTEKHSNKVIGADLFDLRNDPNELKSLYNNPEYANLQSRMESKLRAEMKNINLGPEYLPGGSKVISGRPENQK